MTEADQKEEWMGKEVAMCLNLHLTISPNQDMIRHVIFHTQIAHPYQYDVLLNHIIRIKMMIND